MKKVAIIYGGYSSEWEISQLSAQTVLKYIDRQVYEPWMVKISEDGWSVNHNGHAHPIDKNDFSFECDGAKVCFDVVYNIIHGTPGEDGKILGYFDSIGLPYTGITFYASSLTFHKYWCNQLLKRFGIASADSHTYQEGEDVDALARQLTYPCFVKPNDSGSSFGITKVKTLEELKPALALALHESSLVIIESFLDGTEVSCGVMDCTGELIALPPTEIVTENEFFDYEAKYSGASEEITPARISEEDTFRVQQLSKKVFQILGLQGLARIDFIITQEGPKMIEVNTVPGLSEESIVPKQCEAAEIPLSDLVNGMIAQALNRG